MSPSLPPPTPPVRPASRSALRVVYVLLAIGCLFAFLVLGGVAALAWSFLPGGQTRTLGRAVLTEMPGEWDRQISVGVGRLPVALARVALGFVDLEPEVRAGLRAFRCGDVAIYRHRQGYHSSSQGPGTLLSRARATMSEQGWDPIVTVLERDQAVMVFVPEGERGAHSLQACVLVLEDDQLVLASVEANVQPLMDLLQDHLQKVEGARDDGRPVFLKW